MKATILLKSRKIVTRPKGAGAAEANTRRGPSMFEVVREREFRLFWIGQGIARLGDQFYLIALPWLVLQLTHDPLAMGAVLAVASVPRAVFMLVGGALTDRFSSRTLMLGSDILRVLLVALLAGMVLTGAIELWMIYLFALTFGLVDAFFYPALNAMVPHLVKEDQLQAGNAVVQGTGQLALFAGPVVAGLLIALLDGGAPSGGTARVVPDMLGIGIAFAFNAFTFLVSVITLWMMKGGQPKHTIADIAKNESVWSAIRDGLVYVYRDVTLRTFFLITAAITLLINGPFGIGVPVLAETRFAEGAAAFGIIMSAFGGGMLFGTLLAGVLPKPAPARFGPTLLVLTGVLGVGMALLGLVSSTYMAAAVGLGMGLANGYIFISFMTWLQSRTPPAMLGRMMSLLMFALVGLYPISSVLAGVLIKVDATILLAGAGGLLVVITLAAMFNPAVQAMGLEKEGLGSMEGVQT
jgi:MFS family permease